MPRQRLSIFFHRGDSDGEGGSGFYWLGRKRLRDVLSCLEPDGVLVSDGSNALRSFRCGRSALQIDQDHIPPPIEVASRRFACVGYLGDRNGPTLVWKQVRSRV
jgi:hypothetical protein